MVNVSQLKSLCAFSRSKNLRGLILPTCPLGLLESQSGQCPCRHRVSHVQPGDLRVLTCTYPMTWNNEIISNPKEFAIIVKTRHKIKQRAWKEQWRDSLAERENRDPNGISDLHQQAIHAIMDEYNELMAKRTSGQLKNPAEMRRLRLLYARMVSENDFLNEANEETLRMEISAFISLHKKRPPTRWHYCFAVYSPKFCTTAIAA